MSRGQRPVRIANCSGFFGDRLSAAREMVDPAVTADSPVDVLTGDWLAELTMLILHKQRSRNADLGYASTFLTQMEQVLVDIFNISVDPIDAFDEAMRETQEGIQRVLSGASDVILSPQSAAIRSQQHQLARAANLVSHSYGREPYRRVRIFRR